MIAVAMQTHLENPPTVSPRKPRYLTTTRGPSEQTHDVLLMSTMQVSKTFYKTRKPLASRRHVYGTQHAESLQILIPVECNHAGPAPNERNLSLLVETCACNADVEC
uniref:Uncharacterized protein n=1 Tax=Physcomitrium patens TaxID=3218 RepID=A0A2K1JCM7_PHYPA|nr:hypothetical protein PHYPA_019547 [Physcomitrium patens]